MVTRYVNQRKKAPQEPCQGGGNLAQHPRAVEDQDERLYFCVGFRTLHGMVKAVKRIAPKKLRPFPHGITVAYIGDGKGKTTAAVGAATRAAGYGWKVLFLQFYKSIDWPSGEREALRKLGVDVEVHGAGFVGILGDRKHLREHQQAAQRALRVAWAHILSGKYKLVVLDEVISCLEQKLFPVSTLVQFFQKRLQHAKAKNVHLVLTGHQQFPAILKYCDVVTEMNMLKHPYYKGFIAVKGIDF